MGEKALIYPAHTSGTYYLLRIADSIENDQKVISIPDKKRRYWPVIAK